MEMQWKYQIKRENKKRGLDELELNIFPVLNSFETDRSRAFQSLPSIVIAAQNAARKDVQSLK